MSRRTVASGAAVDRWRRHVGHEVAHVADAAGFASFEFRYDAARKRCGVSPEQFLVMFSGQERTKRREEVHFSLLSLRILPHSALPEQVIGMELRKKDGEVVTCSGDYLEFELLSTVNDAARQPLLKICLGPVRVTPETGQREFMRVDLGQCVRQVITDIIDDPRSKGQKLVRNRWWICLEVFRLVCASNALESRALDEEGAPAMEWVFCLLDDRGAPPSAAATQPEDNASIDELAAFIDGAKKGKAKRKKQKSKGLASSAAELADEDDVGEDAKALGHGPPASASAGLEAPPPAATLTGDLASRLALPPGWSRTVHLAPSLVEMWRDASRSVASGFSAEETRKQAQVAEASGLVHFLVAFDSETRCRVLTPASYVVAFSLLPFGQRGYRTALLNMRLAAERLEFELLSRECEARVCGALRFTLGIVRVNPSSSQRESMRLDLGDRVTWAEPCVVQERVDGRVERVIQQRWWVELETLRCLRRSAGLDASGLDDPTAAPVEWVCCLLDDSTPPAPVVAPARASAAAAVVPAVTPPMAPVPSAPGLPPSKPQTVAAAKPAAEKTSGSAAGTCNSASSKECASTSPPKAAVRDVGTGSAATVAAAPAARTLSLPTPLVEAAIRDVGVGPAASVAASAAARTLSLPVALVEAWSAFAKKPVTHVAEASGLVHLRFGLKSDEAGKWVSPEHVIVTFPSAPGSKRDKGRPRLRTALLTLRVVPEAAVPQENMPPPSSRSEAGTSEDRDYLECELLMRSHEVAGQRLPLQITAGPVRVNAENGQRESMRIDLGQCVRRIVTDVIDDHRGKLLVRNRWWISFELIRLVCIANSLDCSGLDTFGNTAVEWVVCLSDERLLPGSCGDAPESGVREADIDELVDFIDGSRSGKRRNRKQKVPKPAQEGETLLHGDPAPSFLKELAGIESLLTGLRSSLAGFGTDLCARPATSRGGEGGQAAALASSLTSLLDSGQLAINVECVGGLDGLSA